MRNFAPLALLAVLGSSAPAAAQSPDRRQEPAFDLDECARRATHVLVADRRGRVLDAWKGDARPGQPLPMDKILSPALPRHTLILLDAPAALADLSGHWQDRLHARERFILFLVKSPHPLPVIPAETALDEIDGNNESRPRKRGFYLTISDRFEDAREEEQRVRVAARDGWLPAAPHGWFACSVAYVDDFGLVRTRQLVPARKPDRGWLLLTDDEEPYFAPEWRVAGTEESFRQQVLDALRK